MGDAGRQTLQNAQGGNANGTLMNIGDFRVIAVLVVGAGFTGTINFDVSIDGTSWLPFGMTPSTGAAVVTTATANGLFTAPTNGLRVFRARTSAVSAGTVTVTAVGSRL